MEQPKKVYPFSFLHKIFLDLKSETDDDDYDTCHSEESEDEEDDDIEGDDFEDEEDEENGTEDEDDEISNELEPKESKFVKTEKNGKKQNFKVFIFKAKFFKLKIKFRRMKTERIIIILDRVMWR